MIWNANKKMPHKVKSEWRTFIKPQNILYIYYIYSLISPLLKPSLQIAENCRILGTTQLPFCCTQQTTTQLTFSSRNNV